MYLGRELFRYVYKADGVIGKYVMKLDYLTLIGVMSGASTNLPALAFAGEQAPDSDAAAVSYLP